MCPDGDGGYAGSSAGDSAAGDSASFDSGAVSTGDGSDSSADMNLASDGSDSSADMNLASDGSDSSADMNLASDGSDSSADMNLASDGSDSSADMNLASDGSDNSADMNLASDGNEGTDENSDGNSDENPDENPDENSDEDEAAPPEIIAQDDGSENGKNNNNENNNEKNSEEETDEEESDEEKTDEEKTDEEKTDEEAEKEAINEKSEYSAEINDKITSVKELEIYKKAGLKEEVIDGKKCLVRGDIDWEQKDEFGRTNRQRVEEDGLVPYNKNGEKIELHHIGQKDDSPLAELTQKEHRGKGNDSVLHDKKKDSEINRDDFSDTRDAHWKARASVTVEVEVSS